MRENRLRQYMTTKNKMRKKNFCFQNLIKKLKKRLKSMNKTWITKKI